jgi:riboflavin kinase/FMN adenylyltransferase
VEVHLVGREGHLYGQPVEVDFLVRLRDIHSFPSVDALRTQLALDVEKAKEIADRAPCQH